jgi:hypothetical protein
MLEIFLKILRKEELEDFSFQKAGEGFAQIQD